VRHGDFSDPFPTKEEFFAQKSLEKQRALLSRSVVLRERAALRVANKVLKDAIETGSYDEELLSLSIKLLHATEIEGASRTIERLSSIIEPTSKFSNEIRREACLSLAVVDYDPNSSERKSLLLDALEEVTDPTLQRALIDSLGSYSFSEEDGTIAKHLMKHSESTSDDGVKVSIAFALSAIPREDALKGALSIVNSPVWDSMDAGREDYENLGREGDFQMYCYRPTFHDSRNNMKRKNDF